MPAALAPRASLRVGHETSAPLKDVLAMKRQFSVVVASSDIPVRDVFQGYSGADSESWSRGRRRPPRHSRLGALVKAAQSIRQGGWGQPRWEPVTLNLVVLVGICSAISPSGQILERLPESASRGVER